MLLIGGLMYGCVYGVTGLGYSLIYKASGLMNLSQGEFLMLGAMFGMTFYDILGLPYIVSVLLVGVVMFLIGFLVNNGLVLPMLKRSGSFSNVILCTLALSLLLQNIARVVWGPTLKMTSSAFNIRSVNVFGLNIVPEQLLVLGVAVICMFLLHVYLNKTAFGTAMRAAAQDDMAASAVGINVQMTKGVTWGLSAALAGIIGFVVGPMLGVVYTMGALIGNKAFGSAVVGGYGNIYGTIIGGLFFGVMEVLIAGYISTAFKDLISFGVLILVLIFMPNGLFNEKVMD